jgi:membrane-bound lytic murein transglycosylase B
LDLTENEAELPNLYLMSLILESINRFLRRVKRSKKKQNRVKKLSLLFLVLIFAMMSTPTEAQISAKVESVAPSQVKLSTTTANVLVSSKSNNLIVPGESLIQKEDRLKAEAEKTRLAEIAKKSRETVAREYRVYVDPSNFEDIYVRAGATYGVDPKILRAIHTIETGASGSTYRANPSGATGPMQFLPSTFRRHGVDGNGDGVKDIGNVEDAIFSAANYLKACGYPNLQKALWGYNPSTSYYNKVLRIAGSFGFQQ